MSSMIKMALVATSLFSLAALTACQSSNRVKDHDHTHMMKDHHSKHERTMTPEQREQFQQARSERK